MRQIEGTENPEKLKQKVAEKILEKLELDIAPKKISYTAPLFDLPGQPAPNAEKSLGLDSVDGLELAVMLYEVWGIKVQAEEMPGLTTVERIAEFIRQKRA